MRFKTEKLGDFLYVKGRIGWKGLKKDEYLSDGVYRIINGEALTKDGIDWSKAGFISKERYEESPEIMLQNDDILISKDGTIGKLGFVRNLENPSTVASGIFVLRNLKPEMINTRFIYNYLSSVYFRNFIISRTEGSVISHLYQKDFVDLYFPLPSLKEQNKIVDVLDTISCKIEINKMINNNLEQQAQVLYENTFRVPSDIATKSISLSDLMDYAGGSQPPASEFINIEKEGYIRFVQIRDYDTDSHITYIPISSKNKICEEHDIMIARYGASLGRICFGINGAYNVALAKVFPKQPYFREFLRCYLSSRTFYEGINNKGGRSAQAGFNQSDINSFIIDFPIDDAIVKRFENMISPMFKQRLQLKKENQRLKDLRDTLLPRLMSGELDVSEINL